MRPPRDDLSTRLAAQRDQTDYKRRRAIRQFSHRMRAAAIVASAFFALVAYVLGLLALRWGLILPEGAARVGYLIIWLYLASLPLLFGLRTRLFAYVLYEHWLWLALWFGLPLDYYVVQFRIPGWEWIPLVTLGLILLGRILRTRRERGFSGELLANATLWDHLFPLGVVDLLTWGFWNTRRNLRS